MNRVYNFIIDEANILLQIASRSVIASVEEIRMRPDAYTKVVLTVIAICLVWLCFASPLLTPRTVARAAGSPQEVVVVGIKSPEDGNYWGTWSPIFVRVVPERNQEGPKK
jgi:hypothetical protein